MGLDQYAGFRDSEGNVHEEFYWRKHARLQHFFADMYVKQNFNVVNFIFLGFLLLVTIWSRVNIGCENITDGIFATIIGVMIGVTYYKLTEKWNEIEPVNQEQQKSSTNSKVEVFQRL